MPSIAVRLLLSAALAVPVVVGVSGPATAAASQAPVVTQVMPVQGSTVGYTDVVIDGSGFTSDSSVVIGGIEATRVRVLSSHRLAAFAPPHGHGAKNVVVRTSHGTSKLSKASTFDYLHATLPGTWTSSRAELPAGSGPNDYLRLVDTSCPAVSTCYSVGRIANTSDVSNEAEPGDRAVIRTRVGSSYSFVKVPLPADVDPHPSDAPSAEIDAIDCPAVGSCAAVGLYAATNTHTDLGYNVRVLLLTLSDGVWHAQAAPTGSVVKSTDNVGFAEAPEVSCGVPGVCSVGVFLKFQPERDTVGVIYRLSSGAWTGARPVVPSGARTFGVQHVSCPTASFCAISLAGLPNTYVDVLDHNRLTPVTVHAPSGTTQAKYRPDLLALRCPAAKNCVAVVGAYRGNSYDTDFLRMIGSTLSGQAHHLIPTPGDLSPDAAPAGYQAEEGVVPVALECPSTTTCFATNSYDAVGNRSVAQQSVVARLAGSTVHVFVMPEATGTGDARTTLVNLSCPSVTSCVAVGSRFDDPPGNVPAAAYVTFASGVWTPGSLPTVAGQPSPSEGQFVDLDCAAVGHCFADADYLSDPRTGPSGDGSYARSTDLDAVLTPS